MLGEDINELSSSNMTRLQVCIEKYTCFRPVFLLNGLRYLKSAKSSGFCKPNAKFCKQIRNSATSLKTQNSANNSVFAEKQKMSGSQQLLKEYILTQSCIEGNSILFHIDTIIGLWLSYSLQRRYMLWLYHLPGCACMSNSGTCASKWSENVSRRPPKQQ